MSSVLTTGLTSSTSGITEGTGSGGGGGGGGIGLESIDNVPVLVAYLGGGYGT